MTKTFLFEYATVVEVHDGDTITVDIDQGFEQTKRAHVRLAGLNAIELAQPGGKEARDHLLGQLPIGSACTVDSIGYDKFAPRIDAVIVNPNGVDVGARMIQDGYAAAWNGTGPRPVPPWPIPTVATNPGQSRARD